MDDVKVISGIEAVGRMRLMKSTGETFGLLFFHYNRFKQEKNGTVVKYENCRLRSAAKSEGLEINSDHYIYFLDCDTDQALQCWRKLVRMVRFGGVWYKVDWFQNYE